MVQLLSKQRQRAVYIGTLKGLRNPDSFCVNWTDKTTKIKVYYENTSACLFPKKENKENLRTDVI